MATRDLRKAATFTFPCLHATLSAACQREGEPRPQNSGFKQEATAASDLETLKALNLEYVRSVDRADARWFDSQLAPDFMNSNPDGSLVDRAVFLAQIARGAGVSDIEAHDVLIRVIGDLAIIHARTTYKTPSGKEGSGRYTDIWSRRDGRWVCVAVQVTRC